MVRAGKVTARVYMIVQYEAPIDGRGLGLQ